jgi:hypothetical protein
LAKKKLGYGHLLNNIHQTLEKLSGDDFAKIHNKICAKKVKYTGVSKKYGQGYGVNLWEYTEEDDNNKQD